MKNSYKFAIAFVIMFFAVFGLGLKAKAFSYGYPDSLTWVYFTVQCEYYENLCTTNSSCPSYPEGNNCASLSAAKVSCAGATDTCGSSCTADVAINETPGMYVGEAFRTANVRWDDEIMTDVINGLGDFTISRKHMVMIVRHKIPGAHVMPALPQLRRHLRESG